MQGAVCALVDADRDEFATVIGKLILELPAPVCEIDRCDLRRRLMEFAHRVGRTFHDRHHAGRAAKCAFLTESCSAIWFDAERYPGTLLSEWLACYLAMFDEAHPLPVAERAARMLRESAGGTTTIASLARRLGVSRSVLLRQFTRTYGMSPAEYRTYARLMIGIAALRTPGVKVCEAARRAGYRSPSNFNAALKKYLKLTPRGCRLPSADCGLPIENCRLPSVD